MRSRPCCAAAARRSDTTPWSKCSWNAPCSQIPNQPILIVSGIETGRNLDSAET